MKRGRIKSTGSYTVSNAEEIIMSVDEFPFPCVLTFKYLADHWRNEGIAFKSQLELLEKRWAQSPELLEPIVDISLLDAHRDTLELMITPFFPIHSWSTELKAIGKISSERFFYTSPRFEKLFGHQESFILKQENPSKTNLTLFWRLLYAYKFILYKFYGLSLVIDQPMIYTIPNLQSGLDRYYKLNSYIPFSRLESLKPLPALDDRTFDYLVDNFHNMDLWMEYLPPENFVFSGLSMHSFVDVTVEEATARLEHTLLSNHGRITDESFNLLQSELRILFRLPDIRLGLASLQADGMLNLDSSKKSWNSLKVAEASGWRHADIHQSIYGKVLKEGQTIIIEDLSNWEDCTEVESELLKLGVRNITLSPLSYLSNRVGLLEITSPNAGDINPLSAYKLKKVIQFFARAVHENRERFESRIQQVIKENYTAIHPSVEWRFREAALRDLELEQLGEPWEPEPILFEHVFPLYGAADVKGSSDKRNRSIREDLANHMNQVRELLRQVQQSIPLSIIGEMDYTLHNRVQKIEKGMSPGDESATIEFILHEVNPLVRHLQDSYPALKPLFRSFMARTQSGTQLLYQKRKAYESSLKMINDTISNHLLKEQQHLQKIFPHYFEKYQTDGVEYNMYIGSSLVKDRKFAPVYLRNLRLHQLISACEIAREVHDLRSILEEPLDITQLILVHSTPINIRFRMEEKQFDVDGAYNVRYEIMKKRIDKAIVKATKERVSQPGHIAVIYTMDKELIEYTRYIKYLQSRDYFQDEPEHLQLEDLQGVHGLKAIRVKVKAEKDPDDHDKGNLDVLEVARKMGE